MTIGPSRSARAQTRAIAIPFVTAALLAGAACSKGPESIGLRLEDPHGHSLADRAFHEPLDAPQWVAGREAMHMKPEDAVLGIRRGEKAWAIPWWIMDNHHCANLVLDGQPMVITLCERCSSGSALDPTIDGVRHTFKVAGIWNGTIATRDDQSGSYWAPFLGEAIWGPMKGRKLARLRLDQGSWADWLELHPDTLVVLGTPEMRLGHGSDDFAPGQEKLGNEMRRSILNPDERLPMHVVVLGVTVGDSFRAYPIPELDRAGAVVHDELGGKRIVVLHKPGTWLAAAFERELEGRPLAFAAHEGAIVETATQSRFNVAGDGIDGPLARKRLVPVTYQLEEWYVWSSQHPGTGIFGTRQ